MSRFKLFENLTIKKISGSLKKKKKSMTEMTPSDQNVV